jgi:hypothetical protein
MRIDEACALALVEHGAHDVARHALLTLGGRELGDARVDLRADVRSEPVEALAKQLPLRTDEPGDLGEPMAARVAAATARPPLAVFGDRLRAPVDVVVDGEELLSHAISR